MTKSITVELTIKTKIVVDIDTSEGDSVTPSCDSITLVTWNRFDVEKQIQEHLDENIAEIFEETL
jgi:hypothetical protein